MTSMRKWAGLSLLVVAVASCGREGQATGTTPDQDGDSVAAAESSRVVNVRTVVIGMEPFVDYISLTGSVEAEREVDVAAEEGGVVRALHVEKGRTVAAGQPIAKIDDAVIRAQYDQAVAEAELARETWERQRRLWEDDGIGTEIAYLRAKYGAETADANVRVLAARLERTTIRAPIAGILDDRTIEVGSNVQPGTTVARIVDTDPVKVVAGIPERYAGDVRVGSRVLVSFDRPGAPEFDGRTTFVGASVASDSRTFPVEVAVPNAGTALKPGTVARIRIERRVHAEAVVVPREAVLRSEGGYLVYVAVPNGQRFVVESRVVQTGPGSAGRVVIESGLAPGDAVIVVGQQQVANGDIVQVTSRTAGGES